MDDKLLKAILSMDAYNRSYNEGLKLEGNALGGYTVLKDSSSLGFKTDEKGTVVTDEQGDPVRLDENIGFYAIAYQYEDANHQTQTVISYRGTDQFLLDFDTGYGVGAGLPNAAAA